MVTEVSMRRHFAGLFLSLTFLTLSAQVPHPVPPPHIPQEGRDDDVRLPDGKSQKEAIAKADYQKTLEDAAQLVKLSEDLKAELEKGTQYVVSVSSIKKTDEIERLAKRMRTRLKHF